MMDFKLRCRRAQVEERRYNCKPSDSAKACKRWRIGTLPAGLSINGSISYAALLLSSSSNMALTGPSAEGVTDSER
jgi:hypothetical protein